MDLIYCFPESVVCPTNSCHNKLPAALYRESTQVIARIVKPLIFILARTRVFVLLLGYDVRLKNQSHPLHQARREFIANQPRTSFVISSLYRLFIRVPLGITTNGALFFLKASADASFKVVFCSYKGNEAARVDFTGLRARPNSVEKVPRT